MKDPNSHLIIAFYEADLKTMYVLMCGNSGQDVTLDELFDRLENCREVISKTISFFVTVLSTDSTPPARQVIPFSYLF